MHISSNIMHALRSRLTTGLLAVVIAFGLMACAEPAENEGEAGAAEDTAQMAEADTAQSIVDIVTSDSRFSTLATALDSAGLVGTLQSGGPYTVFAPTNEAFDALPEGTLPELLNPENEERLQTILTYHVTDQALPASELQGMSSVTTLEGSDVPVSTSDNSVMVGEATVVSADVQASNGVIHVIDAVLMPPQ